MELYEITMVRKPSQKEFCSYVSYKCTYGIIILVRLFYKLRFIFHTNFYSIYSSFW